MTLQVTGCDSDPPSMHVSPACLAEEWHIIDSGLAGSSARQSPVELACLTRGFFVAKLHPHSRRRALERTRRKLALPKPAQTCPNLPHPPSSIPSRRCSTPPLRRPQTHNRGRLSLHQLLSALDVAHLPYTSPNPRYFAIRTSMTHHGLAA